MDLKKENAMASMDIINRHILKRIAVIAEKKGWLPRSNIFDAVAKRGVQKDVEAYNRQEQKAILKAFTSSEAYHDTALFLLVTGIRLGEFRDLMFEKSWDGSSKILIKGTKTNNAKRDIPVTPIMRKLWKRGNIFNVNKFSFQGAMQDMKKKLGLDENTGTHRWRHSNIVNRLQAGVIAFP
jgi:integrase